MPVCSNYCFLILHSQAATYLWIQKLKHKQMRINCTIQKLFCYIIIILYYSYAGDGQTCPLNLSNISLTILLHYVDFNNGNVSLRCSLHYHCYCCDDVLQMIINCWCLHHQVMWLSTPFGFGFNFNVGIGIGAVWNSRTFHNSSGHFCFCWLTLH